MKPLLFRTLLLLILVSGNSLFAQQSDTITTTSQDSEKSIITKNDGTVYIGVILEQDEREVMILTESIGRLYIPKHEIQSIELISETDYRKGKYLGDNLYATRYFLTTNGLPMKKGDSYGLLHLYGAEYQVALDETVTMGIMTSWLGAPIIGSMKFSIAGTENLNFALGVLVGTGGWASFASLGGLAYGSMTFGDNQKNITLSAGYIGASFEGDSFSGPLFSMAGIAKLNDKVTFVGDSFFYINQDFAALVVPGLRFKRQNKGAFQFGLGGLFAGGDIIPVPIPILSWFVKI